ncbi:TnsA endonuclease N-terminal domain-containing protein [Collimonas fungivorans]|uniref:TnsA endonuclease N-terminal domain-containing protein n=1 Tax=Collimonas fungivorans TaxID=158899 RepID=UPI0009DA5D61|nr:TnsA endonuclease N-terminal domain-containing protein [Collimonas fungivorans]
MDIILACEPARKIRSGNRGVRGNVPKFGRFESTLERELMELLRFSNSVERFKPQPITIPLRWRGRLSKYTPDGLIVFKRELRHSPILYEVKYREGYRNKWRELKPKFRAARALCRKKLLTSLQTTYPQKRRPYT